MNIEELISKYPPEQGDECERYIQRVYWAAVQGTTNAAFAPNMARIAPAARSAWEQMQRSVTDGK